MSILDSVTNMVQGFSKDGGDHAAVASGLLEELGGSGGVAGLIQSFHQNGAGGLIQQWTSGQTQSADPAAMQQVLGSSGLIDNIAQRTGISPDTVRSSLATIVPLLVSHVVANGHVTTAGQTTDSPMPESGNMIQSVLSKLL